MKKFRKKLDKGLLTGILLCGIYLCVMKFLFGVTCLFRLVTGLPCPGCGMTRAGFLCIQGRFMESLQMNAFFLLGAFFLFFGIILKKTLKKGSIFVNVYAIMVLALLLTYYGYRMMRYFPETEPLTYWGDSLFAKIYRLINR
jgi:hypothetical protein